MLLKIIATYNIQLSTEIFITLIQDIYNIKNRRSQLIGEINP